MTAYSAGPRPRAGRRGNGDPGPEDVTVRTAVPAEPPGRDGGARGVAAARLLPLLAVAATLAATPARAASFGELAAWCAPADAGGRPLLCAAYLDAGLG